MDGAAAASFQANKELSLEQRRAGDLTQAQYEAQIRSANRQIAAWRAKWAHTPYASTFEAAYKRGLKDPWFRDHPFQPEPGYSAGYSFADDPAFQGAVPILIIFGGLLGIAVFLAFVVDWANKKKRPPPKPETSGNFGTADYAPARGGIPDQLYIFNGVFFGKSSQPGAEKMPLVQHQGAPICSTPEHHSLVVARTRTGKGTRVVIPTLLRYMNGSALVIDPKGENAAVTARFRANPFPNFKSTVHIINPWGELDPAFKARGLSYGAYNPLDILDRNQPDKAVGIAQDLAAAICPTDEGGKDAYWSKSAASLLTAVLLWLTDQPGEEKTLGRAREIVTKTRKEFTSDFLTKMAASSAFSGAIQQNSAQFIDLAQETYSGVMSNLTQHTNFLSDPLIRRATEKSTFSMLDLMKQPTTLYLVIPPSKMGTKRTWLRLMIAAGMQTYKEHAHPNAQRCLFLIDEFPALGRLDEIPRDIATMSGYGVDFCLIVQGLDQLKAVYKDAHTAIVNNCAYKWFCNVSDLDTARYLSDTLGKKTIATTNSSDSTSTSPSGESTSHSTSSSETGRPLLMPDEVLNLGRDTAILLAPGDKPHYLRPVDYWQLPEAFTYLKEVYPHLYWEPPMKWDENPLPH